MFIFIFLCAVILNYIFFNNKYKQGGVKEAFNKIALKAI